MLNRFLRAPVLLAALALFGVIIAGCGSSSNDATANAVDRAFVRQMVPHHMMAIQMARTAQQQGAHPQIRGLATSIIGDQRAEIAEMSTIAEQIGVKPDPMPMGGHMHMDGGRMMEDGQTLGIPSDQMGMSMNMDSLDGAKPFDRAFVDMMIPHHQGAVRMARAELAKGKNPQLRSIARRITAAQEREIGEMNSWRKQWYGAASPAGGVPTA